MLFFPHASEVTEYDTPDNIFLIEPYLPMQSTIVLFGMPTLGKTPIGWAMAEAVQTGGKFLGIEAQRGNALVLELDMPIYLVKDRWKKARFTPHFGLIFEPLGIDTFQLLSKYGDNRHREITSMFGEIQEEFKPKLVVIDALREVICGDINPPGVADRVYHIWHAIWPDAAIVFIHHESKDRDPLVQGDPLQKASGNMEFVNIAQVGIRLAKQKDKTYMSVTKTQASAIPEPRVIQVGADGVCIT